MISFSSDRLNRLLFIKCLNEVWKCVHDEQLEKKALEFNYLIYADDVVLMADTQTSLQVAGH